METDKKILEGILQDLNEADDRGVSEVRTSDENADDDVPMELNEHFDLNEFQVVRREFFAHLQEPSMTFNDYKISVNAACLKKFPDANFVQVLINQDTKILAVMPCEEWDRDSFAWCSCKNGKRKPKPITCKLFFAKIFSLMNWNPEFRYKLLGKMIQSNNLCLIAFDMTSTEVYKRRTEGNKVVRTRTPVYPEAWKNQFGMTYDEHKQSLQINVFDGYAVYTIKEPKRLKRPAVSQYESDAEAVCGLKGEERHE